MAQHLGLGKPIELSGYIYICPVCKQKLRTVRSEKTNWQEWCFTESDERHFKNRCNFNPVKFSHCKFTRNPTLESKGLPGSITRNPTQKQDLKP